MEPVLLFQEQTLLRQMWELAHSSLHVKQLVQIKQHATVGQMLATSIPQPLTEPQHRHAHLTHVPQKH